jgi:hypothetical protein
MRDQIVVALDRKYGLERLDAVAVVERMHVELVPAVAPARAVVPPAAELEDGDRFVDPAQHRRAALEDLHPDARMVVIALENFARPVEVGVRVIPVTHLLDRQVKDRRVEAMPFAAKHGWLVRRRGMFSSSWPRASRTRRSRGGSKRSVR